MDTASNNKDDNTYQLITKLCEKYAIVSSHTDKTFSKITWIKKARARCYEILLSKHPIQQSVLLELDNINDSYCHFLAWQYQLVHTHNLVEHAQKLKMCVEKLQKAGAFDNKITTNIMLFLLQLRQVPGNEEEIMETTVNRNIFEQSSSKSSLSKYFDESNFHLPDEIQSSSSAFQNEHFKLRPKKVNVKSFNMPTSIMSHFQERILKKGVDEGYESPTSPIANNIWELAAKSEPIRRRTWEEFGCYSSGSNKELPFLSESGFKTTGWLQRFSDLGRKKCILVNYKHFIRDIQYLLVGMESRTFIYDAKGELNLVPDICVEGLSPGTIKTYCKDLLHCASCYKGLNELCSPNPLTLNYVGKGYIFMELCESIKRCLSFYRVAVLSVSHSVHLLSLHERTMKLRDYVTTLASVCKVGPYSEAGKIPHGVALLNYLYQKVMNLTDKNILMMLYSVLYPCCQVYFSRFLQQWILEGVLNDPYEEFFVASNTKYFNSRGRTYWSRGFSVRIEIVPHFLTYLHQDILFCGKAMNLLKLCIPNSPLCEYLSNKQSHIMSCCITSQQLTNIELNNHYYFLEATALSGPRLSLFHYLNRSREEDQLLLSLIAKKRAATLYRIETERKMEIELRNRKKQEEMKILQEQYREAQRQKQLKCAQELEQEIQIIEKNIRVEALHDKLIQEEAKILILYYKKLYETSDNKRAFFEKRIEYLKKAELSLANLSVPQEDVRTIASIKTSPSFEEVSLVDCEQHTKNSPLVEEEKDSQETLEMTESSDYLSVSEEIPSGHNITNSDIKSVEKMEDIENANVNEHENIPYIDNSVTRNALENFKIAQRNKAKIMSIEMGYDFKQECQKKKSNVINGNLNNTQLTEAQKNKLKVMSSEFGFTPILDNKVNNDDKTLNILEINRNKVLSSNKCFYSEVTEVDNRKKDINKNSEQNETSKIDKISKHPSLPATNKVLLKKPDKLSLDFSKLENNVNVLNIKPSRVIKSPKFELDKISPMSIDSCSFSSATTPFEKIMASVIEKCDFENLPSSSTFPTATASAATASMTSGFIFDIEQSKEPFVNLDTNEKHITVPLSMQMGFEDTEGVLSNCLKLCLQQSIIIPLTAQTQLVTNELLKFFIQDLKYLNHLDNLRNYFLLMDGEFGRNITEGLFERLYDSNFPMDLVNCHTLQALVYSAIDYSSKNHDNSNCLSFRINSLPKVFDLGDPNVLDCISLTYKVPWPLNILLPSDIVVKYDEVFKFLLKLHWISWVLQRLFQDLKCLVKQTDPIKVKCLLKSPQYRRIHQCRHVMTHFIQTLQTYVTGEVLQSNWEILKKNMESASNFDQLYSLHIAYIKNILFMCLLNQKSAPLRKVLHKIFVVILKFYDHIRTRLWRFGENGAFVHPNFKRLESIFQNFEELVLYLFKVGSKVVKSGYQPHLMQLLNMLDVNDYYNDKGLVEK